MSDCTEKDETELEFWDLLTVGRIYGILHDGYDECLFTSEELREVSLFLYAEYMAVYGMWETVVEWTRRRNAEELGRAIREAFKRRADETEDTDIGDSCDIDGAGTVLCPLDSSPGA